MLAGLAGALAGPILSVQSGMGDGVLITTLVVIVIGGIGSISGALYASLIVGLVDTLGRAFLPMLLRQVAERTVADAAGPALASMSVYLLMAVVLALRPQGLFPARQGQ
jgi:branched-chain amino acid transport system permease protein